MTTKVVSFDIGGTLLLFNGDGVDNYSLKSLANLISEKDAKEVKNAYKDVFQKNKGTFDELVQMFCNKLEIERTKEINTFFKNKFDNSDECEINSDAASVMKELKEKGIKIICLSNSNCLINNESLGDLTNYIDKVYYSYDLGYTKSDSEIYDIVERDLGFEPEEFLHIGDTLSADYEKPIENGWNAVYFGKIEDETVRSIDSLKDIINYIKTDNKKIR